ncbi:MAG: hypothetical protein R6U11_10625 [Bacteroidales bacterium]
MKKIRVNIKTNSLWPLLAILFVFFALGLKAQKINYGDLIEELDKLTKEQAFYRLFNYQSQNPQFANTYIQLGNVCEEIFTGLDPLQDIEHINHWASNAVLYYQLFPAYLENAEVRRNREYYKNIPIEASGKRLNNEDVINYTLERIEYCKNYKDSVLNLFTTFEKSKDHYNTCVRIFNDINQNYDNLNEVYLQTDDDLLRLLESLKSNFNSSLEEFENYKAFRKSFFSDKKEQVYFLRDIQTFRLDGLTNSNFLLDTFYLWNYEKWTDDFIQTYTDEIITLREEVNKVQKLFSNNAKLINRLDYVDEETKLEVYDEFFLYRIGRYDNNSLIRELFRYLEAKQQYLLLSKNQINSPADSTAEMMNRKLRFYYRLAKSLNISKTRLDEFNIAITPERVVRFNDFFNDVYGGEQGLKRFYVQQHDYLRKNFSNNLLNLKDYFDNIEQIRQEQKFASNNNGISLPLYVVAEDSEEFSSLQYVTTDIAYHDDEPTYACGFVNIDNNKSKAFIAKIADINKIQWLKEFDTMGTNHEGSYKTEMLYAYENGVKGIISGNALVTELDSMDIEQEVLIKNHYLVHLDNEGEKLNVLDTGFEDFPFYLSFDEINQITIMGFGQKDRYIPGAFSSVNIVHADTTGINWDIELKIKGQLVDVVKAEDKYLAFLNYQHYEINNDAQITNNMGENWSFVMLEISPEGEVIKTTPVLYENSVFLTKVFNISSDEISLIGRTGYLDEVGENMEYFIVSPDSEIIFSNLK